MIPTHDRGDVIGRAVASVLRQDAGELEVIVVDDASTDDTAAIVGAISDPRVHYVAVGAGRRRRGPQHRRASGAGTLVDVPRQRRHRRRPTGSRACSRRRAAPGTALVSCGYAERLEGSDVVRRDRLPHPVSPSVGPIVALIETGGSYLLDRALFLDDRRLRPRAAGLAAPGAGPAARSRARAGAVCAAAWSCDRSSSAGSAVATTSVPTTPPCSPAPSGSSIAIATASSLDPPMLANTAATASHRAFRLGRTADARRLALLAREPTRRTCATGRGWARSPCPRWRVGARSVPTVSRPAEDHATACRRPRQHHDEEPHRAGLLTLADRAKRASTSRT